MEIVQTPVRFYPFIGGVENYVYYLSKELVKRNHNVTVICANEPCEPNEANIDGISVKRLNYIGKIANTNITPNLPLILSKMDYDIIHTHLPTPWCADWSNIVSLLKRKPLIVTYHNDIWAEGFPGLLANVYNNSGLKILLKSADRIVITQPNYLKTSPYLKRYSEKICVIPNGVDVEKFKPVSVQKLTSSIFFLSILDEFHQYKGLDYLLKALRKVKKEIPNVRLYVGGSGKLLDSYKEYAKRLDLEENVEFLGFIPDAKLVEYYNKCTLFILPSVSSTQEGFGIVLLEALACKTPVISTSIVGVARDVKDHNAGTIISPKDANQLAEAILHLMRNPDLVEKMGENGRRLVKEKYTWESVSRRMEQMYTELL